MSSSLGQLNRSLRVKGIRIRMKSSQLGLLLLIIVLFALWCFYGTRSSHIPNAGSRGFMKPLRSISEVEKDIERRDNLIAKLNSELSQLKKQGEDCPGIQKFMVDLPVIYVITPTFTRPVQKAELTRLSQTLMLVPSLHWIIVEDSEHPTELVSKLLKKTGMPYTHLNAATPSNWKHQSKDPHWSKPRGVNQRNTALDWIRRNLATEQREGVIYFADDDNSYSIELFDEMRWIKKVGVWPVGLVGGLKVERPKVNEAGKVVGWLTAWSPNRPFAIDMAGFAINLNLFLSRPEGKFAFEVKKGYQESELLRHFVHSLDELEPLADKCTNVYVWHTRTEPPVLRQEIALKKEGKLPSDLNIEV